MSHSLENYQWLMSQEAAQLLSYTLSELSQGTNIVRIVKRLRKRTSPDKSALVVEQSRLRIKARKKFPLAEQMFFTGSSLEMATDCRIAEFKAQRFSGQNNIADVCCSVGGDLIGLANSEQSRTVSGFDADELAVMYANANLLANGLNSSARMLSFEEIPLDDYDAIHIDPERRKHKRTTRGDQFSPALDDIVDRILSKNAAIKVAPATKQQIGYPQNVERQWIGHSRECKQQVVWFGDLAQHPGCRTAVRIGKNCVTQFVCNDQHADAIASVVADRIGEFVYEPHNVILAATLTDAIASKYGLKRISKDVAYLTSDECVSNKLLARFKVLQAMPAVLPKVASELQKHDFGHIEVKKRGIPEFMADNYKRIKVTGTQPGTIILTRRGEKRIAIVAQRETAS